MYSIEYVHTRVTLKRCRVKKRFVLYAHQNRNTMNCKHCGAARFEYRDGIKVCSYCGCETEETPFVSPSINHSWRLKAEEWLLQHNFSNAFMDSAAWEI